jgi:transcriptional regulator with XRE-family HTH domain
MIILNKLRKEFSTKLYQFRRVKGWTQHDLAAEVGASASMIRGYEQMKKWPNPERLQLLADKLGVSVPDLLGGHSQSHSTPNNLSPLLNLLSKLASLDDPELAGEAIDTLCGALDLFRERHERQVQIKKSLNK